MRLFLAVLTLLAISAVTGGPMMGQFAAQAGEHSEGLRRLSEVLKREMALAGAGHDKLGSALSSVLDRIEARGIIRANARAMNAQALSNALVRLDADANIQVYIHLAQFAAPALAQLRRREAAIEIANEQLGIVQAWVPFDRIEEIAALPFVTRVTPPSYGRLQSGSKTTEGDSILKADQLRALGFDGTGVKVGIISDGANNWPQSQASGDLPAAGITLFGNCAPSPRDITICRPRLTCNEGTAMAEIVHDIAPGAEIAVGAGISTSLAFIARVNDLANTFGADIIVDDLGFFFEPYFEDGPVAQAVAAVKDQVVFVSAAGNSAQRHYEADYRDNMNLHDFGLRAGGSSDLTMNVHVGADGFLITFLQWNDRFGLSANDYDLFVFNETETSILASSIIPQNGNDDPIEAFCFFNNTGATVRTKIVVERFLGASRRLEMFPLGNNILIEEFEVPGDSIIGHPAVIGVLATGAIDAADPGNDDIEPFSSRGASTIFFPSFESRPKPDITGIDGVSITGAGGFPNPFFGTSAAAPHVAGIAALLRHAAPAASPAELIAALKAGAVDLGAAGPDNVFGAGRADALAAFAQLSAIRVAQTTLDHDWKIISLPVTVLDPVVIAGPPTFHGTQPGVVRLRNVAGNSFQARFQEWNYLDVTHAQETLPYLVIEFGQHLMPDGSIWLAARFPLFGTAAWQTEFFPPFPAPPALFLTVQSFNGSQPVTVRARNVTAGSFEVALFEEEALMDGHVVEEVGYLAVYSPRGSGSITVGSLPMPYVLQSPSVDQRFHPVLSSALKVEEEQSQDAELGHAKETLSVLALGNKLFAQQVSSAGGDTAALRRLAPEYGAPIEWGTVDGVTQEWTTVPLAKSFANPVVVAKPVSAQGGQPGVIRVRNVTGGSFELRFQEWLYLDGFHAPERVFYLVAEVGQFNVAGLDVEAGKLSSNLLLSDGFETVDFPTAFLGTPAVFTGVMTANGIDPVVTRMHGLAPSGFFLTMDEEEAKADGHATETLGWIAVEQGSGRTGDRRDLMVSQTTADHQPAFTPLGLSADRRFPVMVGDIVSTMGGDPVVLRYQNLTPSSAELFLQEEQSLDSETAHVLEDVSLFVAE